jgi:HisA/HisF family protein
MVQDFILIPVIDLKGGVVVHARAGERAQYRPIETPLGAAHDPVGIARELLAITGSPALYVADLDAILGTGNHFDMCRELADALPGTDLWIDAGFGDVTDCAFWLPLGANLVVGSESLPAIDNWHDLHAVFGQSLVLSLDFTSDGLRGPQALLSEPGLWPDRLVVMSLGRVGTERGPDLEHLRAVVGSGRGRAVHAAGGVRNVGDLEAVAAAGACGALAATALHSGAITQNEIAALLRRRRSET